MGRKQWYAMLVLCVAVVSSQILAASQREWDVKPRIAITFDDGPHSVYTPKLLEGLKKRGVRATFFVIGSNVKGKEDIIGQMQKDGHLIGNHTYDHVKLKGMEKEKACEQIMKTSRLIKEITGKDTEYVRPPFGAWNPEIECGIPMFPVLWTIDPLDWTTKNTDQIVEKVLSSTKEGDMILLHDCYGSSVEAAFRIIDLLQAKGFEFVTVEELILE